jgi:hypothetical protein
MKNFIKNSVLVLSTLNSSLSLAGGFAEGTLIRKPHGQYGFIEDIEKGDTIVSCHNGICALGRVAGTVEPFEARTVHVSTSSNKLVAAEDQTFFIEGKWVAAKDLKIGDIIAGQEVVKSVIQGDIETVYGFEVSEFHNFFANSCLAHNMPYGLGNGPYGQANSIGKSDMSKDLAKVTDVAKSVGTAAAIGCAGDVSKAAVVAAMTSAAMPSIGVACMGGIASKETAALATFLLSQNAHAANQYQPNNNVSMKNRGKPANGNGDITYNQNGFGEETSDNWPSNDRSDIGACSFK